MVTPVTRTMVSINLTLLTVPPVFLGNVLIVDPNLPNKYVLDLRLSVEAILNLNRVPRGPETAAVGVPVVSSKSLSKYLGSVSLVK